MTPGKGVLKGSWPILAALVSAIAKVSIFNLPPASTNSADWFAWEPLEAIGAVVSSMAILTLLFAPLLFLRRRAGAIAAWTLNAIGTLVLWGDLLHFRYFLRCKVQQ